MISKLTKWLEDRKAAKVAARFEAGRQFGLQAISEGEFAINKALAHVEMSSDFGHADEFDRGITDTIRAHRNAGSPSDNVFSFQP